jgi:transcriptional regulator with XRE-family HTH domain
VYPAVGSNLGRPMGSSKALQTRRYRLFLDRLRRAREDAGMTQVEVAKKLGRPQTWISKCELGERRVDVVELEDLAAAYGKPLTFFRTRPES